MQRGDVGFVAGLAGFFLGAFAAFTAASIKSDVESLKNERKQNGESIDGIGARVEDLDRSHKELSQRVAGLSSDPRQLREALERLQGRLTALEQGQRPPHQKDGGTEPPSKTSQLTQDELDALRKKVFAGDSTDDEEAEFWEAAKTRPDLLKGIIADLEKKVGDAPRDIDARMNLARGYLAKLFTATYGPEMGLWAGKAESQWKAVIDVEPNHWDAHYSLAFSYSQYPDFLNKRPDAIREFEALRKIQEASTPEPRHANTYLQLRNLYLKDNRTEDAQKVLDEGLRRFPDDEELKKLK